MSRNSNKMLRRNQRPAAEARWNAVQSRDRASDGVFVYAVRSTGIYCRPSCPSRKPRREQVVFFPLPEAAEQQGFRACRRCRPRAINLRDPRTASVASVCREIDARIREEEGGDNEARLTLSTLSKAVGMAPNKLERAFRRVMGITPRQYSDAQRMRRLKSNLQKGDDVTTALYEAGFGSSRGLYERAPSQLGMTPGTYRQGGAGMQIHYTIVDSPLGRLLVAATDRGISALYLGEKDAPLKAALQKEYPRAEIDSDSSASKSLGGWVSKVLAHLRGKEPHLDLPIDVQATAFRRHVWEELKRIPYGATRTYSEVARAIGRPAAIRAVARACATNPVSVVIPCHRVVRADGNLAGYRWGLERKRALLEHESAARNVEKVRAAKA